MLTKKGIENMAARKKNDAKASTNGYKEFEMKGDTFDYSGRLFVDKERKAGKLTITPMTLCINGVITIKGCSFYETEKNMWVGGPQYKSGDEYKDFLYIDKELNEEMDNLAEVIAAAKD